MKINVLAVGKLRDPWVEDGCAEYMKRLRGKLTVEIVEVKREDELARRIPPREALWVLDEAGKQLSSEELAEVLRRAMNGGEPGFTFVIGGAEGVPAELKQRAKMIWSFGRLTLPHRLARLILIEQLYRAVSIVRGEPYHR
jgi:23S rRNA (pseudouridine1915-N3)-methyltransferase